MASEQQIKRRPSLGDRVSGIGLSSTLLLIALSILAGWAGLWKLLGIAWIAFGAMLAALPLGARSAVGEQPVRLVWGYGVASGAMITSAAVFLVPEAIEQDAVIGGFGIALGVLTGFAIHTVGHQLTHVGWKLDYTTTELTVHALADGFILGLVYAAMPELGLLAGLAIISHKAPAGYASARRLALDAEPVTRLLLPASAVGLAALPVGLLHLPEGAVFNAVMFGFATGVFLHVAMDFLPRCELGSEVYEIAGLSEEDHHLLDRLRIHAVLSTAVGGLVILAAWLLLHG